MDERVLYAVLHKDLRRNELVFGVNTIIEPFEKFETKGLISRITLDYSRVFPAENYKSAQKVLEEARRYEAWILVPILGRANPLSHAKRTTAKRVVSYLALST